MDVKETTKRVLAFRSGNICAKCHETLTVDYGDGSVRAIGECAHIEGEHAGNPLNNIPPAARYNPSMTEEERNAYPNLIYLCPSCHKEIDKIPEGEKNYPVSFLKDLKYKHENAIRQAIVNAFPEVGFRELAEVTRWAITISPEKPTSDYSLLKISDKMKKNEISADNLVVMQSGLGVASTIEQYIGNVVKNDPQFPEKIRDGFLEYYYRFRNEGARGDELFESMCQLAQRGFHSQKERSAGLAVLIYMFEACEVFEK
ncbi:MAG: HNH endonuclease [Lentisphaeria bacterium]|nr:HNH endonuclease [Lentisphaeria bacterium]